MKRSFLILLAALSVNQMAFANSVDSTLSSVIAKKSVVTTEKNSPVNQSEADNVQGQNQNDVFASKSATDPLFQNINQHYSLVIFYASTCPHCRDFDPVVKAFADRYGFAVYPYTTDGQALPAFPESLNVTDEVVADFFPGYSSVPGTPYLFLVNNDNLKRTRLVVAGATDYNDLVARMVTAQRLITGDTNE